eukprot:m.8344 g.8344  ORF g.8344 m.8344 type:complete len:87 (+) comp20516_c0_seq1:161-421(+)
MLLFPQKTISRMLDFGPHRGTGSSRVLFEFATKPTVDQQPLSAEDIALMSKSETKTLVYFHGLLIILRMSTWPLKGYCYPALVHVR